MTPFPLFLALKYLKPKRTFISVVTVISVIGVLLGVAILVIVMSVMTGFDNMWREKILSFKPHLTVLSEYGFVRNEEDLCERLENVPGVTGAAPVIETLAMMQYEGGAAAPIVLGVAPERSGIVNLVRSRTKSGTFDLEGEKIVIGFDMAMKMGLRPGSKILLHSPQNVMSKDELYLPEELTVAGVFNMGMRDFDSVFVFTSLDIARDLVGLEEGAHAIYVMTEDPFRFESVAQRIREELGPGYMVRTWKDVDQLMFKALTHEKVLMGALLGIITVVAIFCVTNTLIVITYQKTSEIGLLKAVGVPSWKVMMAFVIHGWIQCITGIALGIGVAFLVLHNLARIVGWLSKINVNAFPKEIYGLSELPWAASWGDISLISLLVIVFCTLISLIPAGRAVWLDPVEALRHE
jgi:lipoprotein-releasing system permease protein